MVKRWVIFEDVTSRACNIAQAVNSAEPSAEIEWLACCSPLKHLPKEYVSDFPSQTRTYLFDTKERVLAYLDALSGTPTIFVTDIKLEGVHSEHDDWLAASLSAYLRRNSHSLVVVSSSRASIAEFFERFSDDVNDRVTDGNMQDLPGLKNRPDAARRFVEHTIQKWNRRFGDDLESMWHLTIDEAQWFSGENPGHSDWLPHDWEDPKDLDSHRRAVKRLEIFNWFPDDWWNDFSAVKILHENLKSFCGVTFCEGGRNLSVGAAWLIAGAAWNKLRVLRGDGFSLNNNPFCGDHSPAFWAVRPQSKRNLLPRQSRELGKECIKDLFVFFQQVFTHQSEEGTDPKDGKSSVSKAILDPPGCAFRIVFTWKVSQMLTRIETRREGLFSKGGATGPLTGFLNRRQIGASVIGARSTFWIESNTLTIAGAEDIR